MEIEIVQLIWDEVNIKHIWEKHKIRQEEIEQAVSSKDYVATRLQNGRVLVIGLTAKGRLVSLILSPRDINKKIWYPVTARTASRKELRMYNFHKGGKEND